MRVRECWYFLVIGIACGVAYLARLWPLPLIAFVVLEGLFTLAEAFQERRQAPVMSRSPVKSGETFDRAA
jgi:hypothetical protein